MSVSNDQSQPVRKVIPYKKDGRRTSPFSEMAFQYSGTALDVAIQQREHHTEIPPPDVPAGDDNTAESAQIDTLASEVSQTQPVNTPPEGFDLVSPSVKHNTASPLPSVDHQLDQAEKQTSQRSVRLAAKNKYLSITLAGTNPELRAFIDRWKPFLTDTQLRICTFIYNNSTAIHQEFCFTSTSKLMAAVSKTERQVKTVLNQLIDWEFVIKGETIINVPRDKRGTHYKLNPDKS